ncbi:hypothetical protein CYY_001298 [Polysphondylium violaceum]|uniref:FYVE-type domain-containing protein n=1 Tax=Polysphondylium violaceum TaxID=133409 RepID=A0A8J4V1Q8_9MYCE|nr:hypothetical protein CYY_001298 [Polysphondylium violaceum]
MIVRDRTSIYLECRQEAKKNKEIADRHQFLNFVKERNNNQQNQLTSSGSSFPNIFSNKRLSSPISSTPSLPKEKLTDLPHCLSCGKEFGLFRSKQSCNLCLIGFCSGCIKKYTSKDITGVIKPGQEHLYCYTCAVFVNTHETTRKFNLYLDQAKQEPIFLLYTEITLVKKAIIGCLPNFEYLATSITDFTKANAKNKETFMQVYNEVIKLQEDLAILFKEFDKYLKLIINTLCTTTKSNMIKSNMKSVYVTFLQQNLPKFKNIQNQVMHLEMNTATNIYIVLCRIAIDNQLNREFWYKYGKEFQDTISIVRKELFGATLKCGENFDNHKKLIDDMICSAEKSHLNIQGTPSKELEGTLLRKNIDVLVKVNDQINLRVKPDELIQSKQSLYRLLTILSKYYQEGLKF